jgi:hypothetical protein
MQTSPPVSHQVYYKSETQYGWPSSMDYNPVSFKFGTRELVTNSIFQSFGGPTIIVENPPTSDYLTNGHHQWPIGATAIEGYDPSMMTSDVRECVSL